MSTPINLNDATSIVEGISYKEGAFVNANNEHIIAPEVLTGLNLAFDDNGNVIDATTKQIVTPKNDFLFKQFDYEIIEDEDPAKKKDPPPPTVVITYDPSKGYINDKGEPIFTPEELKGQIFNADGDLLDTTGKVVKTSAQIISELNVTVEDQDDTTLPEFDAIVAKTGIVVVGEDQQPKVYEPTVDGFAARELDVLNIGIQQGFDKALENLYKQYPVLPDVMKYLSIKGNLEGFANFVDYSKMTPADDDKEGWKAIIVEANMRKDPNPDRLAAKATAERLAGYVVTDGKWLEDGKTSLTYLTQLQAQEVAAKETIEAEKQAAKDAVIEANVEAAKKLVLVDKAIKIGEETITIPDNITRRINGVVTLATKDQFLAYLALPKYEDEYGRVLSQFEAEDVAATKDPNLKAYRALLRFVGGDESLIVRRKVEQEKVNGIKKINAINKKNIFTVVPEDVKTIIAKGNKVNTNA
jgi:hypothetical protein